MRTEIKRSENSGINYVVGVSWPRSGHGLLARILSSYFGKEFIYCPDFCKENNLKKAILGNCCEETLCANREIVHFCKNHDFHFNVPKVPGQRYIIQYRDFAPSVVSNFELRIRNGNPDTFEDFQVFSRHQAKMYFKFVNKWVFDDDTIINKTVVKYEDLTKNTFETLTHVINHFKPSDSIDSKLLRKIINTIDKSTVKNKRIINTKKFGIKDTRSIKDFRFYDEHWFSFINDISKTGKVPAVNNTQMSGE